MHDELRRLRLDIDASDRKLVELLAARFEIVERVAQLKAQHGIPARIQSRIRTVIERREAAGRGLGIPRMATAAIWKAIVEQCCQYEEILMSRHTHAGKGSAAMPRKAPVATRKTAGRADRQRSAIPAPPS